MSTTEQSHTEQYWEGYNAAIADMMEKTKGKGAETQRDVTDITSDLLKKESEQRQQETTRDQTPAPMLSIIAPMPDTKLHGDNSYPVVSDFLHFHHSAPVELHGRTGMAVGAGIVSGWTSVTEIEFFPEPEKPLARSLTPEDRILNAMAGLLEDAKGKGEAHKEAMAKAAADITKSVKEIKELRQHTTRLPMERIFGEEHDFGKIFLKSGPSVTTLPQGPAVVSDKTPEQIKHELDAVKQFADSLTGDEKKSLSEGNGPVDFLKSIMNLSPEKVIKALGLLNPSSQAATPEPTSPPNHGLDNIIPKIISSLPLGLVPGM